MSPMRGAAPTWKAGWTASPAGTVTNTKRGTLVVTFCKSD